SARAEAAPHTSRMPEAPASPTPAGRTGDTRHSGAPFARGAAGVEAPAPAGRPRTDTVALVEGNARRSREVPTWLALVVIVALSLAAGLSTYLLRIRSAAPGSSSITTSASVDPGARPATP
ncbi:MAG: Serine/threonine protein kinase PrkC, regulator of stationary phase, partial [Labilithrix sp.]|nr:Serine/threonine protein kinase PrkC, regulator of stationary phase [Labilithrix sp.]